MASTSLLQRDVGGSDFDGLFAISIRETNADGRAADADVNDFA
jgi:hypothetical protein